MTKTNMDLSDLMAKHDQADLRRSIAEAVLQLITETGVAGLIGAGGHERSGEHTTWRNGYRDRDTGQRLSQQAGKVIWRDTGHTFVAKKFCGK